MKSILKGLLALALPLLLFGFPYIWNAFIVPIGKQAIEVTQWDKIISPVVTTYLSIVVIYQSQQQQKANKDSQDRLERINKRMLTAEISSQIGYLLPYDKLYETCKSAEIRQLYPHDLHKEIKLYNAGDADIFILGEEVNINGNIQRKNDFSPLYISQKNPYREFCFMPKFSEEELSMPQIDFNVIFNLKNVKGYYYQENLLLGFKKTSDNTWNVYKLNMEIKEAKSDAD